MKKSVLFLPASIRSHVVPALYLADLLAKEYDIYFAVTNEILEEIVLKQGYHAVRTGTFRVALGMEAEFLFTRKGKVSKWQMLKSVWNNELYHYRQKELSDIVDQIKPTVVFIERMYSNNSRKNNS